MKLTSRITITAISIAAICIIIQYFTSHHSNNRIHYENMPDNNEMQFYHKVSAHQRNYLPLLLKDTDTVIIRSSPKQINTFYIKITDGTLIQRIVSSSYIDYYRILQPDSLLPDISIKFYKNNSLLTTVDYQEGDNLLIYGNPWGITGYPSVELRVIVDGLIKRNQ